MLVLAALEGRKLEPDFNYPQHSARVTSWDVNIYFDWLLALIAGPVEIIATGEYTIDGTRYTFTGQYTRVVDPVTANTLARTLRGSTQTIWFDPTDPQVASWQPLGYRQILLYAGVGWAALLVGLVPIAMSMSGGRKRAAALASDEGIQADADYNKGVAALEAKQYKVAIASFDKVLKGGGDSVLVHKYRARAYYALNDLDGALKAINGAIRVEPQDRTLYLQRIKLHLKRDDLEGAVRDLSRALELQKDDDDYDLYIERARLYERWNNFGMAMNDYNTALKLRPDGHIVYLYKAQLLEKRELHREALEAYEAYLYSGLADERGDAADVEARIKTMYTKGWR
ncbi:MAG: tetratricopeptide repeat protein [Chloroflexota bacterium]|nr:tetratricopeptide repeat protein [Chloroflexota bacterium]